jgi:dGTPase
MHSADSLGRKHPQAEHPYRGPYQRDRDRILHSHAFRRLSHKMQVFTGDMGDYHRTRLTHTHEVATIARTMGRVWRLNEDLIEALALFHDIGHPPFGHAGEDALDECLAEHGGFSHNQNALTIAEELEIRYPDFPGLNLTREVLAGQATRVDKQESASDPVGPLLEVQAVEAADSMTYDAHDADDAVKLGLVTLAELEQTALVREAVARARGRYANLTPDTLRKTVVHELVERQVTDVLQQTAQFLGTFAGLSAEAARRRQERIGPGAELAEQKLELERLLYARVYRHPRLIEMRTEAQMRLKRLFAGYVAHSDWLPAHFQRRIAAVGLPRTAGEYLAGMTDRFCDAVFARHFGHGAAGSRALD